MNTNNMNAKVKSVIIAGVPVVSEGVVLNTYDKTSYIKFSEKLVHCDGKYITIYCKHTALDMAEMYTIWLNCNNEVTDCIYSSGVFPTDWSAVSMPIDMCKVEFY